MEKERFEIFSAGNGFITKHYFWEDSNEKGEKIIGCDTTVIETEELDDKGENKTLKKLLERVAEWTGYTYDKWSKNNLKITFDEKGRKLD